MTSSLPVSSIPSKRRLVELLLIFGLLLSFCPLAQADQREALKHYQQGRKAYDLGRFEPAIEHFSKAYEAEAAPEFLFNIAQAHRQLGRCRKALFFYRRYLRLAPDSVQAPQVRLRIEDLESTCPKAVAPQPTASQTSTTPPHSAASKQSTAAPGTPQPPEPTTPARRTTPSFSLSVDAGLGFAEFGDLEVPAQASLAASATYRLDLGRLNLGLGLAGTLFMVPYEAEGDRTAFMTQALGQAELTYALASWLQLRGELGVGLLIFSGLRQGNPFTIDGAPTSGPLSTVATRASLGLDVPLGPHWRLRLTPATVSFSPRKAGLSADITRLLRVDVTIGIALRL